MQIDMFETELESVQPDNFEKTASKFILDELRAQPEKKPAKKVEKTLENKYYRVKEMSEILGVPKKTIHQWEKDFNHLRPSKTRSGHRVYSYQDAQTLLLIHELVVVQALPTDEAKKRLRQEIKSKKLAEAISIKNHRTLKQWKALRSEILLIQQSIE